MVFYVSYIYDFLLSSILCPLLYSLREDTSFNLKLQFVLLKVKFRKYDKTTSVVFLTIAPMFAHCRHPINAYILKSVITLTTVTIALIG